MTMGTTNKAVIADVDVDAAAAENVTMDEMVGISARDKAAATTMVIEISVAIDLMTAVFMATPMKIWAVEIASTFQLMTVTETLI